LQLFRLFIALTFSLEDLQKILKTMNDLQHHFPTLGLRWVQPSNIHLTMKFLGNVEHSRLPELNQSLLSAVENIPPCSAEMGGLGAYPSLAHPQIIYLGLKPDKHLDKLFVQLENSLFNIGFPKERKGFSPHVTLARISDHIAESDRKAISTVQKSIDVPVLSSPIFDTLYLVKSDLDHSGPTYTKLFSSPLHGR
jgi:2'-5' RNA ligase